MYRYILCLILVLIPSLSFAEVDQSVPRFIAETAKQYGIDPGMALYVSWHESNWKCSVRGDGGHSRGCWQISKIWHPKVSDKTAFSLEKSTHWAMKTMQKDGGCKQWSTCPNNDS